MDVKRSALADLKTLLTILQDRRREAAYTIYDDTTSRDTQYFSYIVSVTANRSPCVSINTLSASGRYLAYMERGDPPPRGEELVYRKGRVLPLVETAGRVEFVRIMMGLLGRACTRRKVREKEELELEPEETQAPAPTAAVATGRTWDKVKRKSWFIQSIIPNHHNVGSPHGKAVPKVTDWINTLEVN